MKKHRVYLDNCCFNRPYDDQLHIRVKLESDAKMFIQQQVLDDSLDLVWSHILSYENAQNPFNERRSAIQEWEFVAKDNIHHSEKVIENIKYAEKLGIVGKDALHVACAITAECDYFFTTDDKLLKKLKTCEHIQGMNPLTYITLIQKGEKI